MRTVFTGFVVSDDTPYSIIDVEELIESENDGISFLDSNITSYVTDIFGQNIANGFNTEITGDIVVPNPWPDLSVETKVTLSKWLGPTLYLSMPAAPILDVLNNGMHPIYKKSASYGRSYTPSVYSAPNGAFSFNLNKSGLGSTGNPSITTFASGVVRYKLAFAGAMFHMQIQPDGSVFFFHTKADDTIILDRIGINTGRLSFIGELQAFTMYCLRASTVTATGVVYNAAGGIAPNCSVMGFDRVSGRIVGKTKSKADGSYEMMCSAKLGSQLFMVCLDDDGVAPDFNAQIIDRIVV